MLKRQETDLRLPGDKNFLLLISFFFFIAKSDSLSGFIFYFVVPCKHTSEKRTCFTDLNCRNFLIIWFFSLCVLSCPVFPAYFSPFHFFLSVFFVFLLLPLPLRPTLPIPTLETSVSSFWWCSVATTQRGASEIFMLTHIHKHTPRDTNTRAQTFFNPLISFFLPVSLHISIED